MQIRLDDLTSSRIADFLREHLDDMYANTPPESVHALDIDALRAVDTTFWSAWQDEDLLGCGALKELDSNNGEIKSMRTVVAHRGKGVAAQILALIISEAERRAYNGLYLETGKLPEFAPARALYRRFGFTDCGPFATYTDDPNSAFMKKLLRQRYNDA